MGSCLTSPELIIYAGTWLGAGGGGSLILGANGSGDLFNRPFLWFESLCFTSDWTARNDSSQSMNDIMQSTRNVEF